MIAAAFNDHLTDLDLAILLVGILVSGVTILGLTVWKLRGLIQAMVDILDELSIEVEAMRAYREEFDVNDRS